MARHNVLMAALNRGEVSPQALARVDQEQLRLAANTMVNWRPTVLGPMKMRPGLAYLGGVYNNAACRLIPFVRARSDTALIELTDSLMRVWVDEALITRASVSTTVTNGSFGSNISSWTDNDETGGTSAWVTGGYLGLTGNGFDSAIVTQQVTVGVSDQSVAHALRIVIARGPVLLRVGSSSQGQEYVTETALGTGTHSIAFTPTGDFYITFKNKERGQKLVDSVAVESSGTFTLPAPWAAADLPDLKYDQSGDVIFVANANYQPRRIERRNNNSWSIVAYETTKGPFRTTDDTTAITMTPSARTGNISLTASKAFFTSSHVGAIFRLRHTKQVTSHTFTGADQWTDTVHNVNGVGSDKSVSETVTGIGSNTITIQNSFDDGLTWRDSGTSFTTNGSGSFSYSTDNVEVAYRATIRASDYSGSGAAITLTYKGGNVDGIVRITAFTSSTVVSAEVLKSLGDTGATRDWEEGSWSDERGWPSSVRFHDGRLWWGFGDTLYGSASDDFTNFDLDQEGASATIIRELATGPTESTRWMLSMQRFLVGNASQELSIRSSSFDEPLTPTQFTVRTCSRRGSSDIQAQALDTTAIFVQQNGLKVFELFFSVDAQDYGSRDLTRLNPDLTGTATIVEMGVQREPDTNIYFVLSDGTVAVLTYEPNEGVVAWWHIETTGASGLVENVAVLPGTSDDLVYFVVKRTINGSTVRYLERLAFASECVGGTNNKIADSHTVYSGASTASMTGLSHLEGATVVVWGGGKDLGSYTVSGGAITLSEAITSGTIGLSYTAQWKSAKLAYGAVQGTALLQKKRIDHLGMIMLDTHYQGITYGPDFDNLDDLPAVEDGATTAVDTVWSEYDKPMFTFPGIWDTDSRLCLQCVAPRPATVAAIVIGMNTSEL